MKKILPLLVVGILVLSGLGATAVINIENNPPDAPTIAGETRPKVGVSYCFTFITVDPDGDDVSHYIEWGDGTSTGWTVYLGSGEGASFAHTWDEIDWDNIIRCKAKDIHGAEGNWSKIQIPIMKNKDINLQSYSILNSQSVMSVIPSTGKTDVATSRTTFNDGTLSGYVNDTSMNPIEGARVRVHFHGTYEEDYTDSSGYYHVTNIPICYCLKNATCSKEGYRTEWVLLSIDENTTHDFILMFNQPPSAPKITGPQTVRPGTHEWTFKAIDPDGDTVSYYIDWDDGDFEDWFGPFESGEEVTRKHTVIYIGTVTLRARAKDIHGAIGNWGYFEFEIPKSEQIINPLFLQFLERFPILQKIMDVLRLNN